MARGVGFAAPDYELTAGSFAGTDYEWCLIRSRCRTKAAATLSYMPWWMTCILHGGWLGHVRCGSLGLVWLETRQLSQPFATYRDVHIRGGEERLNFEWTILTN